MTRASESSNADEVPNIDLVQPPNETTSLGGALQVAGDGATALAQGSLAAGLLLARTGAGLVETAMDRAKCRLRSRTVVEVATQAAASSGDSVKSRRRRRALLLFGAVGAVAAGGAVFYKSRHLEHPPVAAAPPRLGDAPGPRPAPAPAPPHE